MKHPNAKHRTSSAAIRRARRDRLHPAKAAPKPTPSPASKALPVAAKDDVEALERGAADNFRSAAELESRLALAGSRNGLLVRLVQDLAEALDRKAPDPFEPGAGGDLVSDVRMALQERDDLRRQLAQVTEEREARGRLVDAARQEAGLLRAERDRSAELLAALADGGGVGGLAAKVEALGTVLGEKLDGLEVYLRANQERNERRDASLAISDKAAEERAKAVVSPLGELLTLLNAKFNGVLERLGENGVEVTEQCQALLTEIRALGDRLAVLETGPKKTRN